MIQRDTQSGIGSSSSCLTLKYILQTPASTGPNRIQKTESASVLPTSADAQRHPSPSPPPPPPHGARGQAVCRVRPSADAVGGQRLPVPAMRHAGMLHGVCMPAGYLWRQQSQRASATWDSLQSTGELHTAHSALCQPAASSCFQHRSRYIQIQRAIYTKT